MFYITISNGLLEGNHQKKMGTAVWQFMWLLDKVTKIGDDGWGWVLGGKPINLKDFGKAVTTNTVSRNLQSLKRAGYIIMTRTPYGLVIKVAKAKKRFTKNGESHTKRINKYDESNSPQMVNLNHENGESRNENGESNKTVSVDKNNKTISVLPQAGKARNEVDKLFDLFYESINPMISYGNTTNRKAAQSIIIQLGLDHTLKLAQYAISVQGKDYAPVITTPYQLREKMAQLKIFYNKHNKERTLHL